MTTQTEQRRRGRPSVAAQRREQILDAVESCIVRFGFEGTTLQRIAREAGVSRSNLAHFVGNRDEIIDVALARCVSRFTDDMRSLVAGLPASERLPAFIEAVLADSPDVDRRTAMFNELFATACRDEEARAVVAPAVAEVDGWIEEMVNDRHPDADPALRAAVAACLPLILKEYDRTRTIGAANRGSSLGADVRAVTTLLLEQLGPPATATQ